MTTEIPSRTTTPAGSARPPGGLSRYAHRQPIAGFLALELSLGWTALTIPNVTGQPAIPYLLAMLILLLGTALLVTRWADGPDAVHRLLGRALLWRFNPWRSALILLGMPAATCTVASALGTAATPDAWTAFALTYLFQTVVLGCLLPPVHTRSPLPAGSAG